MTQCVQCWLPELRVGGAANAVLAVTKVMRASFAAKYLVMIVSPDCCSYYDELTHLGTTGGTRDVQTRIRHVPPDFARITMRSMLKEYRTNGNLLCAPRKLSHRKQLHFLALHFSYPVPPLESTV